MGSRLVLLVLLIAVMFGAYVAMKGQQGVEKLPPMADDFDISIGEGAVAPPSSRPNPTLGDQPSAGDDKEPATSKSVTQDDSQKSFDETLADIAKAGAAKSEKDESNAVTASDLPLNQGSTTLSTPKLPDVSKPDTVAADTASQPTLSTPIAVYSPPKTDKERASSPGTSDANSAVTKKTEAKSVATSSTDKLASYPTTAFPNPVDWNRFLGPVSPSPAITNQNAAPRVAVRSDDAGKSAPAASTTVPYPTTAWPYAPTTTTIPHDNGGWVPNGSANGSPVITR